MISYYELLGMINEGEAPRKLRVYLTGHPREYEAIDDIDGFSYYSLIGEADDDYRYYLAESYVESCMFDDNIEIIEEDKKIEKIDMFDYFTGYDFDGTSKDLLKHLERNFEKTNEKLNEIIDYINKENE